MAERLDRSDAQLITPDFKGKSSARFEQLKYTTANNFPEAQFRAKIINGEAVINPYPFGIRKGSDGEGTKAEIEERLYETYDDPKQIRISSRNAVAMVEGDAARKGGFLVGIDNVFDVNSAKNERAMDEAAIGIDESAAECKFAVLSGEIAELDYRVGGYGKFHFNWNMVGTILDVPSKRLESKNLKPGQSIVAFREPSLRTNGFTDIREAMADFYLDFGGGTLALAAVQTVQYMEIVNKYGLQYDEPGSITRRMARDWASNPISYALNHREILPWHEAFPDVAAELVESPTFYSPIMYDAQGGVFGDPKVKMIAAAHITGGGVPLKGKRMVEEAGLGLAVDPVFPDPKALTSLFKLAEKYKGGHKISDDRKACDTWNRGIGFIVVVENKEEAKKLIEIAESHDCEGAVSGEVIDKKEIQFRGHTWKY